MFTDYKELATSVEENTALKKAKFCVIGQETVQKICETAYGLSELDFKNTLHAPDLISNLILINRFGQTSFNVTFGEGLVYFWDPNRREVMCGKRTSEMYLLGTLGRLDTPSAIIAKS